jgi:preprotein translocase subunit SecB
MQLTLNNFLVSNLTFKNIANEGGDPDKKVFDLKLGIKFHEEINDLFSVIFSIKVIHPGVFELDTEYIVWFKTSEPINEAFKQSDFPSVNAPAIAFPFLRSFISTVTLNAGYEPAILPSINFVNFKNKAII